MEANKKKRRNGKKERKGRNAQFSLFSMTASKTKRRIKGMRPYLRTIHM